MPRSFAADTPDGPATISIVSHEIDAVIHPAECGQHGEIRGDRFVLRSTVKGLPDVFTVVERTSTMVERGANNRWKFVTDELTAEQLANWQEHRSDLAADTCKRLAAWLSEY